MQNRDLIGTENGWVISSAFNAIWHFL